MLHIHNGDASADVAKQSSLPGEHFAFREALIDGPTPSGLSQSNWRQIRARHLSESYGVNEECVSELSAQEAKLATFREHEEVVLWFEHDLFCQVHLIHLLNWFGQQQLGQTKLSLICVGEFPGKPNFRGLGELDSEEFASLFPKRQPVTSDQLTIGAAAWQAYTSPTPSNLEEVLEGDTHSLPFLHAAVRAHLRRFPSTTNGLGAVESRGLELIQNGPQTFEDVFHYFRNVEPVYGLGDSQFWMALRRMIETEQPLLKNGVSGEKVDVTVKPQATFEITDVGREVLKANADFVELNGIDLWLGGVHLTDNEPIWRWDANSGRIVQR